MNTGQVCMKIAGRDAGQYCVIVEELDSNFVLIDGNTRRRKCNLKHLEPVAKTLALKKGASTEEVKTAMKKAGLPVLELAKKKTRETKKEKPPKQRTSTKKKEPAKK